MDETREGLGDGDIAAELLPDFANNGGGGIFAGLNLSPGEFPLERQVFVRRSLCDKDASVLLDHGADDWNGRPHEWLNKERHSGATFLRLPGSFVMKTAVKIILVVAILLIAIKLSPIVFVLAMGGLLAAALLGAVGLSLLAGFAVLVFALAAALSPIWIPVLAIVGLVALFKKLNEPSKTNALVT